MPSFVVSLLAVLSGFILGGKPVDIPPYLNEQLQQRGIQISTLAQDFNSLSPTPTPHNFSNPIKNDEDNNEEESQPDKVPAYNYSSDKEMPTNLPSNAVENSPSLGSNPPSEPNPTCTPPPPCLYSSPRCMMAMTDDMCPLPPEPTEGPTPSIEPEPIVTPYDPCPPFPGKDQYSPQMIYCLNNAY